MTSMLGSVTSWLVGVKEPSSAISGSERTDDSCDTTQIRSSTCNTEGRVNNEPNDGEVESNAPAGWTEKEDKEHAPNLEDFHDVSEKALNAAKEWGTYFFSVGKAATEQVAKTAKHLKETVEEKTILGDFSREQEKFVSSNREKKKSSEAAVAPWVGYNEEEAMKMQILALSKDKRNVLRNPPAGVQFYFDYDSSFPIAMVMLDLDPNLKALRFELVPKQIKEELFWRNYFYRVSLIKQSTQLTSMTQSRASAASLDAPGKSTEVGLSAANGTREEKDVEEMTVGSPPVEQEFVSDAFQDGDILDEELKKEMHQLGVTENQQTEDEIPEWERELQAELQEYEVVGDDSNVDDADLEREIMNQIEADSKTT